MAVITNRAAKLVIEELEYPGFLSFSGNDSSVDQSGLVQFQATVEIGDHHLNPQDLNPRKNRFWGFGKKIQVFVQNSAKEWVLHPRGTVWLYTAFYDFTTRILNIQCGCLIYILKNRSTEDFQDPEDIVNVSENKIDPETDSEVTIEKEKYWWEVWQKEGEEDIENIVKEVLLKLDLQKIGKAIGQVRLPWQPSGSLLQAIGELVFKSIAPSYLWCDNQGKIRVERLPARAASANVAYTEGGNSATSPGLLWELLPTFEDDSSMEVLIGRDEGGEIEYTPYDSGQEPIKELLITGRWKEVDEEVEVAEDGSFFHCELFEDTGPETLIDPDGSPLFETVIARGERCEYNYVSKKVVKEWREERRKILFPDTRINFDDWIRMREIEYTQYFDILNNNRLYREVEITKECVGKVYGPFLQNNADLSFVGVPGAKTIYADALTHEKALTISSKVETTYSYAEDLSLKEKKVTTYEPQSKILDKHFIFSDELKISEENIEKWGSVANNGNHQKIRKVCWFKYDSNEVEKLDKRLYQEKYKETGEIRVNIVPGYERTGHFEENNTLTTKTVEIPTPVLTPDQKLALISEKTKQRLSNENGANAPSTEYLPDNNAGDNINYKEVGGFVLKRWKDPTDRIPPREIVDLGEVYSQQVIDMVGEFIYFLRQGYSQAMRVKIPLNDRLINEYKPFMQINIIEYSGDIVKFLIDGSVFDVGGDNCILSCDCLWLGTSGQAQKAVLSENQWIEIGGF